MARGATDSGDRSARCLPHRQGLARPGAGPSRHRRLAGRHPPAPPRAAGAPSRRVGATRRRPARRPRRPRQPHLGPQADLRLAGPRAARRPTVHDAAAVPRAGAARKRRAADDSRLPVQTASTRLADRGRAADRARRVQPAEGGRRGGGADLLGRRSGAVGVPGRVRRPARADLVARRLLARPADRPRCSRPGSAGRHAALARAREPPWRRPRDPRAAHLDAGADQVPQRGAVCAARRWLDQPRRAARRRLGRLPPARRAACAARRRGTPGRRRARPPVRHRHARLLQAPPRQALSLLARRPGVRRLQGRERRAARLRRSGGRGRVRARGGTGRGELRGVARPAPGRARRERGAAPGVARRRATRALPRRRGNRRDG